MINSKPKICIVSTIGWPLIVFMGPHIKMLSKNYDVTLVANSTKEVLNQLLGQNVHFIPLEISREIAFYSDFMALIKLYKIFIKGDFILVHSILPKSGLIAMIAAFIARIPFRVHTFTGQVWANKHGFVRLYLKLFDLLLVKCASNLLADSFSQKQFLINEGLLCANKINVLGNGSICGVDISRFSSNCSVRNKIRTSLKIPLNATVCLFLGRLSRDKGVIDLALAFSNITKQYVDLHLLVVGPDEGSMDGELGRIIGNGCSQFHRIGFTEEPEKYMAAADIFCLPSYREGFGSAIIEAAASNIPAVASNIYGLSDAVVDGLTGILYPPGDIDALEKCLLMMYGNKALRDRMGRMARARAVKLFSTEILVEEMRVYYNGVLHAMERADV